MNDSPLSPFAQQRLPHLAYPADGEIAAAVRKVRLTRIAVSMRRAFDQQFLDTATDEVINEVTGEFEITLHGFVWGERVQQTIVQYPRDWWQALKERWMPKRWRARWPIVYTIKVFTVDATYPDFKPSMTQYPAHMMGRVATHETTQPERFMT